MSWPQMTEVPQAPALSSSSHQGDRIVFGSIPGHGWGLAFDSTGNLYAAEGGINFGGERAIYKFAPDGTSTVFADSDQFAEGEYPIGLAFDSSSGNLYVSIETFTDPEADSIVYFTPMGVKSTFATRLTTPRGLAFDSSRNLFVAEANAIPDGDILKFTPGGVRSTFATGFGRPEFLTFGPPR